MICELLYIQSIYELMLDYVLLLEERNYLFCFDGVCLLLECMIAALVLISDYIFKEEFTSFFVSFTL